MSGRHHGRRSVLRVSAPHDGDPVDIPLFPLGTVLLPGLVLPLHIFEERYRTLVAELIGQEAGSTRQFGVIAIRHGREVGVEGAHSLFEVGCSAVVHQVQAYPDGRFDLVSVGGRRFELLELDDQTAPYLRGRVAWLEESAGDVGPHADAVRLALPQYVRLLSERAAEAGETLSMPDLAELPEDPVTLSYLVAATLMIDTPTRQGLLAQPDAGARLAAEVTLLRREQGLLGQLPSVTASDLARQRFSPN
jgi:Lon protease-like protein